MRELTAIFRDIEIAVKAKNDENLEIYTNELEGTLCKSLLAGKGNTVTMKHIKWILELLNGLDNYKDIPEKFYEKSPIYFLMKSLCRLLDLKMSQLARSLQIEKDSARILMSSVSAISSSHGEKFIEILNKFSVDEDDSGSKNWRLHYYVTYCKEMISLLVDNKSKLKDFMDILQAGCSQDNAPLFSIMRTAIDKIDFKVSISNTWYIRQQTLRVKKHPEELDEFQHDIGNIIKCEHFPTTYAAQEALYDILNQVTDPLLQNKIVGGDSKAEVDKQEKYPTLHYFCGESAPRKTGKDCSIRTSVSEPYQHNTGFSYRFVHGLAEVDDKRLAPNVRENFNHIMHYMMTANKSMEFAKETREWLEDHQHHLREQASLRPIPHDPNSPKPKNVTHSTSGPMLFNQPHPSTTANPPSLSPGH